MSLHALKEVFEIVDPFMAVCRARLTFEPSSEPAVLVSQYHLCSSLGGAFVWLVFKFPKRKQQKMEAEKRLKSRSKTTTKKRNQRKKKPN